MAKIEVNINLNRVEGDLEIGLTLEDGVVTEARTIGTLYRGFEQIMLGRTPRDALVITPPRLRHLRHRASILRGTGTGTCLASTGAGQRHAHP